jgi:hypothetical protein
MKPEKTTKQEFSQGVNINSSLDDRPKGKAFAYKHEALEKAARETNLLEILRRPPAPLK